MNRAQRRATAKAAAKNVMAELRKREASGQEMPGEITERQAAQAAILQEYKNAVAWQKLVTELYDHTQESLRWSDEDSEDRQQLEADAVTARSLALAARFFTFETGLAFADCVDPRPESQRIDPADVENLKAVIMAEAREI